MTITMRGVREVTFFLKKKKREGKDSLNTSNDI